MCMLVIMALSNVVGAWSIAILLHLLTTIIHVHLYVHVHAYTTDTGMLIQCYMIQYTHVHHVHVHVHVHSTTPLSPTVMLNSLYTVISHNNIVYEYYINLCTRAS